MNGGSSGGIIIKAGITYQDEGKCYTKGFAVNLIILDMGIEPAELRRILSAWPNHYDGLSRYGTSGRRTAGQVPINLVLNGQHYHTMLKKGRRSGGAWIPSGPLTDQNGRDVKLAGALRRAGLNVQHWTNLCIAHKLPPRYPPLQQVEFVVHETTWTFPPHGCLTQRSNSPNPGE